MRHAMRDQREALSGWACMHACTHTHDLPDVQVVQLPGTCMMLRLTRKHAAHVMGDLGCNCPHADMHARRAQARVGLLTAAFRLDPGASMCGSPQATLNLQPHVHAAVSRAAQWVWHRLRAPPSPPLPNHQPCMYTCALAHAHTTV